MNVECVHVIASLGLGEWDRVDTDCTLEAWWRNYTLTQWDSVNSMRNEFDTAEVRSTNTYQGRAFGQYIEAALDLSRWTCISKRFLSPRDPFPQLTRACLPSSSYWARPSGAPRSAADERARQDLSKVGRPRTNSSSCSEWGPHFRRSPTASSERPMRCAFVQRPRASREGHAHVSARTASHMRACSTVFVLAEP